MKTLTRKLLVLYPHLHHLKSFAIPELGQLRVHSPITMSHPVGLITSFRSLTTLVISSGWMLCTGLGRAIAQIRPTIFDAQPNATDFSLVILDWRFKTYYNEPFHHHGDEASMEDFRHTLRSTAGFFNALNPNSITSLDVDFAVRYNRPRMPDLNDVAASIRHSRSMKALRLAHFRCTDETLLEVFKSMGRGGFQPKALALFEVCNDSEGSISRERWQFPCDIFDQLEHLELTRFSGMFDFAAGVVRRRSSSPPTSPSSQAAEDSVHTSSQPQQEEQSEQQPEQDHDVFIPRRLRTLKLIYTYKHLRESASEAFILFTIPRLSATLHTLKLVDTDHDLMSPIRPRRRTRYDAIYGHIESPLESLTNLHTLILTGDIAAFLLADRLPQIISALKSSLVVCDLCFPALPESLLQRFWELDKLQTLVLREWNWEDDDPRLRYFRMRQVAEKKLTVETVKKFWERCRVIKGPDGRVMLGLRELGIAGGFLEVAGGRSWGGLRRWGELRGGRFWWGAGEMPKVG